MNDDPRDDESDPQLTTWLRLWKTPRAPAGLEERLRASYRAGVPRPPAWTRVLKTRITLPLPLAALVIGLALAIGMLAGRHSPSAGRDGTDGGRLPVAGQGGLANLRPLPEVRITVLKAGGDIR
jgi:hypothetical protein